MATTAPKQPKRPASQRIRTGLFIAILIFLGLTFYAVLSPSNALETKPISDVISRANDGKISKISGSGNELTITLQGQDKPTEPSYITGGIGALTQNEAFDQSKVTLEDSQPSETNAILLNVATIVLPMLIIGGLILFMFRQAQGQNNQAMGFGKSRARLYGNEKSKVTFSEIAGNNEAKQDLVEVVDFLKHPKKFLEVGAKIPKGVLLVGP
ncbi:MAG TPA: cell division protein FtsH, partial [Candidatus Saccharibacteria bacterium]|nr:cell division protein FtsH [Candidatus Saccharibacteria bacterium]